MASPDRTEQASANLNVPVGLSGRQRDRYLSLTDDQKAVYRYQFITCGRLAQHSYLIAVGEQP